MHRMKCKFEFYHKPQRTKNRDPFEIRKPHPYNPERLTDNGTLDTFLHRVRLKIMNEHKHKQNKSNNLTRKERQALNQLINNPMLIINKADKGSTIVVQDRSEYIAEAMKHLNDQTTYKPLRENITHKLKDLINNKLQLLLKKRLPPKAMVSILQTTRQTQNLKTILSKENLQKANGNPAHSLKL